MSTHLTAEVETSLAEPLGGWRRMIADTLLVSGSTLGCQVLGAVTSIVLRALLDPAQIGVWQGLKIFLSYANYANLGISKGATQELAAARGRGDLAQALRGLNLAHAVNTLSSVAYALILTVSGVVLWSYRRGEWTGVWAMGLALMGLLAIVQRHVTFKVTILRAQRSFAATTQLQMIEAVVMLVASMLGIWLVGLWGMFLATAAVLASSVVFLRRTDAPMLSWQWDWPEIRRLVGIGGPILAAGVASSLFRSLDKLLILGSFADKEYQLGCYSLALLVGAQLYGMANMISTVMTPRYSELLGRTNSRREVARLAARASEMQAALLLLPAGAALVAAPPLLMWLLPKYADGLPPLVWMVPSVVATSMALPASQFLIAVDRGQRVVVALLLSTAVAWCACRLAIAAGWGLLGISAGMLVANGFYLAVVAWMALWRELSAGERLRYAAMLCLTMASSLMLAAMTSLAMFSGSSLSGRWMLAMAVSGMVVGWCAVVGLGWRYGGWGDACRKRGGA
jgi:O-antigen/teichoic acid export membrane protein